MANISIGGRANQRGVIAPSCGAITCVVISFLIGLPMLITTFVLFAIANGDYDFGIDHEHCPWSENYDAYAEYVCNKDNDYTLFGDSWSWDDECRDCTELRKEMEDWSVAKQNMRIAAIVLLVNALVWVTCGVMMLLAMYTAVCKPCAQGAAVNNAAQEQTRAMPVPMTTTTTTATPTGTTTIETAMQQPPAYTDVISGNHPVPQRSLLQPTQSEPVPMADTPPSYDMVMQQKEKQQQCVATQQQHPP